MVGRFLQISLSLLAIAFIKASAADAQELRGSRAQGALALTDVPSIALQQNPDVLEDTLEVSKTEAHLKSVITQRYPKLLAIGFAGQQVTSGYGQNLALLPGIFQPVSQQYRVGMQVHEASLAVQSAKQHLRKTRQRIVASVKTSYLSLLALQSSILSREHNLTFLIELERQVKSQVSKGSALPVDLLLVQAQVARADFDVEAAKDDFETMRQQLNRLLGRAPRTTVALVDEPTPITTGGELNETAVINEALNKRPELTEVKLSIHRASLERKIQLSGYIPDISFGATGIFSHQLDITLPRSFTSVGFLGVWEPWDWGRRIQLSKEAERQTRQETIKLRDLSESVSISADKSRRAVKVAQKEAIAGALAESSTKEELRVIHRRFIVGAALLKDVLEADTAYSRAIAENVKAKVDVAKAYVELDEALGRDF